MRVAIATVGIGHWYPSGVARMIQAFKKHCGDAEVSAWTNLARPMGAPHSVIVDGYDYTGYCVKPFALREISWNSDICILLDSSFFPIKDIASLVAYVCENGYYMMPTGFAVGEWSSEAAIKQFCVSREDALSIKERASGCVCFDVRKQEVMDLISRWAAYYELFPGPHSNDMAETKKWSYRNVGHVSDDPRVLGHRHDQTVLSLLAHEAGMTNFDQPRFASYAGGENADTVLVSRGM